MIKRLITGRIFSVTSLVTLMLFASSSAWATYYLYTGTNTTVSGWSTTPACSSSSLSFTISDASMLSPGLHYFGVNTNDSGINTSNQIFISWCSSFSGANIATNESAPSAKKLSSGVDNCVYGVGYYTLTATVSGLTITLAEGQYNEGTCGTSFKQHSYSIVESGCSNTTPSVTNGTISVSGTTATILASDVTSAGTNSDCSTPTVTSRGVHFTTNQSANPMPTYYPSVTTGTGEYNTVISDLTLTANTYYYRSFATNAHGTRTTDWSEYTFVPAQRPPSVRIGKKLKEVTTSGATQGNVDVSAYIAATGCANVTKIRVFYSNNSAFRDDEEYRSASFEKTLATPITTNNNRCDDELSITKAQVLGVVSKGETLYVRLKAVNANGLSSAYSDVAKLTYQYDQFIIEDQTITATACEGQHQFKWTGDGGMFNPVPDGFEVRYDNAEGKVASSEFSLVGDYMVWTGVTAYDDNEDASPVEHVYYFTADKEGYDNVSATATFNLSAQKLDDVTVTINEGVVDVTDATIGVEPWELIELTATRSDVGTDIEWTAPEDISLTVSNNGANASVKGKKASESVYQVSVRALNSTCGRSPVSVVNIKVDGIQETCTNSN